MARLWLSMGGAFGHKWFTPMGQLPVDNDGKLTLSGGIWSVGLSGLSDEQIFAGFERCVTGRDEWPPSLPGFRAMCFCIPSLAQVRQEFKNTDGAKRSPFARKLWQFIDSYQFGRADQDKADRMFREAYDLTREHVMNGGELPQAPVAVIENEKPAEIKPASEDVAKKHIEEILGTLKTTVQRPTVVDVIRQNDMAADRCFICATLSDGRVVRPPALETCSPPPHAITQAIEAEIEKLYPQEKTP